MSWIPEFEIGTWNAWIFMIWMIILQFLPSFILKEREVYKRLNASVPMKFEKLINISSMALIIVGFLYSIFLPLKINTIWFFIGLLIFLFGWILVFIVLFSLREAKPNKPFTMGPYRYSRHPGYFSLFLIFIGISIMSLSWIFLVLAILFIIQLMIIVPAEERYCLKRYGKEYQDYMERTPRWIGFSKSEK